MEAVREMNEIPEHEMSPSILRGCETTLCALLTEITVPELSRHEGIQIILSRP